MRMCLRLAGVLAVLGVLMVSVNAENDPRHPFRIRVVDSENGWPVPLVELRTVHQVRFFTDNAGVVAFDLPELMGRETWLFVESDNYEVAADGFGYHGVRVVPEPGGEIEIELERTRPAKRLGRITGAGLFAESRRFGDDVPPADRFGVLGCDSVQNAVYRGRLFWAWGDTKVARYPLGIFHTTGATTPLRPLGRLAPPLRIEFDRFVDGDGHPGDGRARGIARMEGKGPTWIDGLASIPDRAGRERLVASYLKVEPPLTFYRVGLCAWNDETESFESVRVVWEKSNSSPEPPPAPHGHPVRWNDENGRDWLLFGDPFPTLRVPAVYEDWLEPSTWEPIGAPEPPKSPEGNPIDPHRGSIAWNPWRDRWVTVFCEEGGDASYLGEIHYAEAASPLGPWGTAVKVLSHRGYSFYNPRVHPGFSPEGSPILLFEGTYTKTFSKTATPTPRHDYNQVLYRLDLDDPALAPAQD